MVLPAVVMADDGVDAVAQREASAAIRHYQESVSELEAEEGAWAPGLQQELLGLGLAYQRQGQHAEAIATLSRAEHLTRINEGLYSRNDLPILEHLIESHAALGDWDRMQNRYRQIFLIHQRNYGNHDDRLLPVLNRLSAWHMRAYLDAIGGGEPIQHLISARQFYDSAVSIIETNHGPRDPRIADALRRRALVDYYVAGNARLLLRERFAFARDQAEEMAIQAQIANSFASGRDALRRVVILRDQDASSNPMERSEALAELADWHQLFARRQSALRLYQQAWARGDPADEETRQVHTLVFGKPRLLPQLPAELNETPVPRNETGWIKVRFKVSENGRASDMQVLESAPPASDREISRLRRRVLGATFRPRFAAGQPVATDDVDYQYSYSP